MNFDDIPEFTVENFDAFQVDKNLINNKSKDIINGNQNVFITKEDDFSRLLMEN